MCILSLPPCLSSLAHLQNRKQKKDSLVSTLLQQKKGKEKDVAIAGKSKN
jgi:hypothetical protein